MPIGCKGSTEFICLAEDYCCAFEEKPYSFGVVTDKSKGELCRTNLYCCSYACFKPKLYCKSAQRQCCFSYVASFPFDDEYVKDCICAECGLQCCPSCGCCVTAPPSSALTKLDNMKMVDMTAMTTFEMTNP
eukprot:2141562-Ditylum_brightwellii.AAC.1